MTTEKELIEVAVDRIFPSPDNYRKVRTDTEEFRDLLASVQKCGVIEPVIVRHVKEGSGIDNARKALGVTLYELLSGHRRWTAAKAAGLTAIPAIDKGEISDEDAFDIIALGNLHVALTPLEEGQRAATWLDKYGQDAAAVASKLGKTVRWVHEHAQIFRGLSAEWRKEAAENPHFDRWTASHWAVIAKLPARIQTEQFSKFHGQYCSFDRWSVKELEDKIGLKTFLLAKATFDVGGCEGCANRSGAQPLLWGEAAEDSTGPNERCLDKKCFQRKTEKAERAAFKQLAQEKGVPEAVPISLMEEPEDYFKAQEYREKLSAVRKIHKGLVTADRVTLVKEDAKGAVPAIVVAGRGRNSVKWVRISEPKADRGGPKPPSPAEIARQKAEQEQDQRKEKVIKEIAHRIGAFAIKDIPEPFCQTVLYCSLLLEAWPGAQPWEKQFAAWCKKLDTIRSADEVEFQSWLAGECWTAIKAFLKERSRYPRARASDDWAWAIRLGPLFGLKPEAMLQKLQPPKGQIPPVTEEPPAMACSIGSECTSDRSNCASCPNAVPGDTKPRRKKNRKS